MIREVIYSKKTIDSFIEPLEQLFAILNKEQETEKMIKTMGKYNIVDFIRSHPVLAYEENIIDINVENDNYSMEDIENAIAKYCKERKSEIDNAINAFMSNDIFQLYSDVLSLQDKYEELVGVENKKSSEVVEYVSAELKKMLKNSVIESSYKLFIEPLKIESINGKTNEVVMSIQGEWAKGMIESRFKDIIEHSFEKILGMNMEVIFIAR